MSWDYRVVKTEEGYTVYEVFYDEDGNPVATTEKPALDFHCETPEGLMSELDVIRMAFESPLIDLEDIGSKK